MFKGKKLENKGIFISFEGADGSGKTTQVKLVSEYLKQKNKDFIATRDPGGTELGRTIRKILLNSTEHIYPTCELFLYLADRAQHIDEKILPALKENKIVLCDRFIDSTLAYQGYARKLDKNIINQLNEIVTHSLNPDITILFDVDTNIAIKRIGQKKDRLESENSDFHQKVRQGYLKLAQKFPERIKVINANQRIEKVFNDTVEVLESYFKVI